MIPRMKNMTSQSCSRAFVPSLIRLATILGLCINMGMHVQAQTARKYTVGSGYINGSLWTNTVNGVVEATFLEDAYKNWSSSVNVTVGDSLIFNYERGAHTVYIVKTLDEYTSCSVGNALQVTDGSPTTYTVKASDSPTLYFLCNIVGHCKQGQKVAINIPATNTTKSAGDHLEVNAGVMFTLLAASSYLILLTQLAI